MADLSTKARRLLERLAVAEVPCMPRGETALELWHAGLAEWNDRAGSRTWWLKITDKGRAALGQL